MIPTCYLRHIRYVNPGEIEWRFRLQQWWSSDGTGPSTPPRSWKQVEGEPDKLKMVVVREGEWRDVPIEGEQ